MSSVRLLVCVNQRLGAGQKSCAGSGSRELIEIFKQRFIECGLNVPVVEQVCLGRCAEGITMRIAPGGPFYTRVTENDIEAISSEIRKFSQSKKITGK